MYLVTLCISIIAPPNSLSACLGTQSGVALWPTKHTMIVSAVMLLLLQTVIWLMQPSVAFMYVFNFFKLVNKFGSRL